MTDLEILRAIYHFAARHSVDPSTQTGAALRLPGEPYPMAPLYVTNRFPPCVNATEQRLAAEKSFYMEHAERAAIYAASWQGKSTNRAVLYCTWAICADCARAVVMSGISELVAHRSPIHTLHPKWLASITAGGQILDEGGVPIRFIDEPVGVELRFNGETHMF